jgi:bifunctional non-homologous end joining protein LigD
MNTRFVIQEHQARTHHFDFRLEKDGVLKSWAVPKGVPEEPGTKRLAIQVEDHPLEYGGFEGAIPAGQYGAGTVRIWDRGTCDLKEWTPDKIVFTLHGARFEGNYSLVRFKKGGEHDWLLIKRKE